MYGDQLKITKNLKESNYWKHKKHFVVYWLTSVFGNIELKNPYKNSLLERDIFC